MTNTELIQAIKTEIERHLNSATEHQNANPDMPKYRWYLYEGEKELCTDLLGYIDYSLESEKPMQEGLEEEIEMEWDSFSKHLAEYDDDDSDEVIWLNKFSFTDLARHFAQWGIKSQEKKIADAYEKGKQEGIRVIRSWESSPGQGGY